MSRLSIDTISVLLVEPSSAQSRIIENHLRTLGVLILFRVKTAGEALREMRAATPDLVISAMHLADMTGAELVQAMRAEEPLAEVPFMLISSETHYRYLEPIRQAGVIALLPKPFTPEQLQAALQSTLNYLDPGELAARDFASEELKVLVVDDSSTARRHISRVLRNMGIEDITTATNGVEALAIIADNFFDLVVTDYNMPQMNGKELVEQIRESSTQASIPVLMVSSESDDSRIAAVQQAGVSAICDKPFESGTVKRLIEGMLN
ncbi:MAG TPA: response regulator [Gammaproteobacteria bacterium]|nr:response regulator [Gammaproteobacteria bacterium]